MVPTFKCEPLIRIGIFVGAVLLGWVGTALVAIYGEVVTAVIGGQTMW